MLDLAFVAVLAAIVGSRLLYVLFNLREYLADPLRIFKVWEGGLVFHGGLLLAIPVVPDRRPPLQPAGLGDGRRLRPGDRARPGRSAASAASPPAAATAPPGTRRFCVTYTHPEALAPLHVPLFPSQLFAFASGIAVFAVLVAYRPRRRAPGQVFWLYLVLASAARLAEDAFRGTEAKLAILPWLSATQAISLGARGRRAAAVRHLRPARRPPDPPPLTVRRTSASRAREAAGLPLRSCVCAGYPSRARARVSNSPAAQTRAFVLRDRPGHRAGLHAGSAHLPSGAPQPPR